MSTEQTSSYSKQSKSKNILHLKNTHGTCSCALFLFVFPRDSSCYWPSEAPLLPYTHNWHSSSPSPANRPICRVRGREKAKEKLKKKRKEDRDRWDGDEKNERDCFDNVDCQRLHETNLISHPLHLSFVCTFTFWEISELGCRALKSHTSQHLIGTL